MALAERQVAAAYLGYTGGDAGRGGFKRVAEQTGILTKEPDHPPQEC
jgi:hypothetical protein